MATKKQAKISRTIAKYIKKGKPQAQAVAIAINMTKPKKRKGKNG